jgi:hypothetical protein
MAAQDHSERDKLLLYAGLGIGGYFLVLKPLLKKIGIDPGADAQVTTVDQQAPDTNPFNMNSQYGSVQQNPSLYTPAYFINIRTIMTNPDGLGLNLLSDWDKALYTDSEAVYNAFYGFWNQAFGSDFQAVLGVFNSLTHKGSVSDIDAYLQANYNISLWPLLKNGHALLTNAINNGLSNTNLAQIVQIVDNLPDY